jgi:hypothetical protein
MTGRRRAPGLWRERAMWWMLLLIVLALIVGMGVALQRRGPGDPAYRPDDRPSGEHFTNPAGGGGTGDGSGF